MKRNQIMAYLWTGLLLLACLIPGRWLSVNESDHHIGMAHVDKIVHVALFAGFGFFWGLGMGSCRNLRWVLTLGVALAILTELGQGLSIIERDPDMFDSVADLVGLALGCGLALMINGRDRTLDMASVQEPL